MSKPTHLRKRGTNEIHIYTPRLAMRGDMIPHSIEEKKSNASDTPDPNKIQLIVEAIGKLAPEDFTGAGMPKCPSLSEMLKVDVSAAERDEAWAIANKSED